MRQNTATRILRSSRPTATTLAAQITLAAVLAYLTTSTVATASDKILPDAATILDRYVEVTGGKDAYAKIHNRVSKERVKYVGMDFEDTMVVYEAGPNLRFVDIESQAFGTIQSGTDGKIVWYLAENTGPIVQNGDAKAAGLREAEFHLATKWRELYEKAESVAEENVDGKPAYKIVMTPKEGPPETAYFDKQSNLLVKVEKSLLFSNMPPMPVQLTFSDYKPVDDLLIPHKLRRTIQQCGGKREMLFLTDSIEHNVNMPASRFEPPKEIVALAGAASTEQPQSANSTSTATAPSRSCGGGSSASAGASACGGGSGAGGCAGGASCAGGRSGGCGGGGRSGCSGSAKKAATQESSTPSRTSSSGCGG